VHTDCETLELGPFKIAANLVSLSVISLVQHLYEQSAGKVMFDGHEVRNHNRASLWCSLSVLSNEIFLM